MTQKNNKVKIKMAVNKESVLEMFDFLHDVITDNVEQSKEWFETFNLEYNELRDNIELGEAKD